MIQKYSVLKNKFELPDDSDYPETDAGFEEFYQDLLQVSENKKQVLEQKLSKFPAVRTPKNGHGQFQIISKEPSDKTKWRVTTFETKNGEEIPTGHSVCNSISDGSCSVFNSLSFTSFDWGKWAAEK